MQDNQLDQFDVVIVGGGIAGSALALSLASSSLRVALIEAALPPAAPASQGSGIADFDLRVSALTAASQALLQSLGVWPALESQRVSRYQHMYVWDAEGTGNISFDAAEVQQPQLGHIVENRLIVQALMARLRLAGNITVLAPSRVETVERLGDENRPGWRVSLDQGEQLFCHLLVGADGALSKIRQLCGFESREWDYGHHAIVATVATEKPHQLTAWQRFMPEGPLAFLPLTCSEQPQRYCSIVWSTEPEQAEQLLALDDEAFCTQLTRAFEAKLGRVEAVSNRAAFPLRQRHAVDYCQPGVALIADAAHTIHPLAGQGINLGLQDVEALATEILRAGKRGVDPSQLGSMAVLGRYQRQRKAGNLGMMAAMEGFKWLFAEKSLPIRWLRNQGMRGLNDMPMVKQKIIRQAMGL